MRFVKISGLFFLMIRPGEGKSIELGKELGYEGKKKEDALSFLIRVLASTGT